MEREAPGPDVRVEVAAGAEVEWFDRQLADRHYLGAGRAVGDYLRQVVKIRGQVAALLVWGPACYALKDRDLWISWSANQRVERLKLIVQNRRFLILAEKGAAPNVASQAMGAALRALPEQWQEKFGYRPLLAESFTDPEAYAGTCYKASNWEAVGFSVGYSRHRADFYVAHDRPKKLWLRELGPQSRRHLRAPEVPAACRPGLTAPPSGVLPLSQPQMLSLEEALRAAPDPRGRNTRFRSGPVLALVAMALLAGRRDFSEIARFASTLSQKQRHLLGLPRKKGTKAFYQVPTYSVFYALLTLAQHEDGAPQAVAICDQKEGTPRCEQGVGTALLESFPALDHKTITADALHCLRPNARAIVEKGGEYLLQIKANQPRLLAQAQAFDALPGTPFFPKLTAATAASKPAASTPSRLNRSRPTSPSPAA